MKRIKKHLEKYLQLSRKHRTQILFILIFAAFLFLRFYELPDRAYVGWDQADSAWAARSILREHPLRLEGVPIKGNASMFLGPLYYYLIAPFYFLTDLDMIASPIFASVISVAGFLIFYFITKRLFSTELALLAAFLYTFSMVVISADRLQAAFVLIPILSYIVFYFLYKFLTGDEKYLLYLGGIIGFGFHIHFTAVFYILLLLFCIPFFPRTKKTLLYGGGAVIFFLLFLSPILASVFFMKSGSNNLTNYLSQSYHGFHLRRVLQLVGDGFIAYKAMLQLDFLSPLRYVLLPVFIVVYGVKGPQENRRDRLVLCYLMVLMLLIPWLIFSTYSGELTDYYFSQSRYLAIIIIAYLLMQIYLRNLIIAKALVISILIFFAGYNLSLFFSVLPGNYLGVKQAAETAVKTKQKIPYDSRNPLYYMYDTELRFREK